MFDRPRNGLSNVIIDSFVPRLLVASKLLTGHAKEIANFPSTAVTLSPWFSSMFGVRQMPLSQMCKFLGYEMADIKDLFRRVKAKDWSVTFIGYGGTNVNTLHWLSKLAQETHTIKPFKYIDIFENDNTDVSNLLRFPKDPSSSVMSSRNKNKLNMLQGELETLSRLKPVTKKCYFKVQEPHYGIKNFVSRSLKYVPYTEAQEEQVKNGGYVHRAREIDANGNSVYSVKHTGEAHVFYGAPNIQTRVELSEIGNFISATHGSNDCSLHLNPTQDTELQVESYGMIQLGGFFMNQLKMAIGLLETLADSNFDPTEKDKPLMTFEFDGIAKKRCDRTYQFQMNFAGNMLDEADAANL